MIGGGYIAVPLLTKRYVEDLKFIDKEEMSDLVSIAQSGPGAIAVNSSLAVGYRMAGVRGAFCALFGAVLPPLVFITLFERIYSLLSEYALAAAVFKGMNAAVAAIMIDLVLQYTIDSYKKLKWVSVLLLVLSFSATYFLGVNPAIIVAVAIVVLGGFSLIKNIRKKGV